jgi:urease accessory protein
LRTHDAPTHAPLTPPPARPAAAGSGLVEVDTVAGRTSVIRMRSTAPLKLLAPRHHSGGRASIFASTFGGGLVAGDQIDLDFTARGRSVCWLGTQASTKVYKSRDGAGARQTLRARVAAGATLFSLPDPVTCYAGARYEQRQRFELERGAALVALDWLTGGRTARGERWQFDRYESRTDVHHAGDHAFADAVRLDPADGPLGSKFRTGGFDCLATLVVIGEPLQPFADQLVAAVAREKLTRDAALLSTASPIRGGAVLRVAGPGPEVVARYVRSHLSAIPALADDDPWARKW